jgi:LytS/YehU family sensor histidine kinase
LASISPEIQEKAPDAYQKMLKLFKLTRATLNNKSMTESLEIQLQQIEDYLLLEKTMLNQPLHFNIDNQIIEKEVQIPRLLLKNLVENAIKHGIRNKTGEGHIQISILEKEHNFHIIVDDDGVGKKQSVGLDTGLGTGTYKNLFAILNQKNKSKADFEIIDKDQGTKVVVKIPVDYKYV